MQKHFKTPIIIFLFLGLIGFSQEKTEYQNVILDGKPAKLNVLTGEITLIENSNAIKKNKEKRNIEKKISESTYVDNHLKNQFHLVEKGQTLYSISKYYGITITDLKAANNLESNIISSGQRLIIKNKKDDSILINPKVWIVSKGDTLFSVSKQNGLSVADLKEINGLENNIISIGQKLRLK